MVFFDCLDPEYKLHQQVQQQQRKSPNNTQLNPKKRLSPKSSPVRRPRGDTKKCRKVSFSHAEPEVTHSERGCMKAPKGFTWQKMTHCFFLWRCTEWIAVTYGAHNASGKRLVLGLEISNYLIPPPPPHQQVKSLPQPSPPLLQTKNGALQQLLSHYPPPPPPPPQLQIF